MFTLIRVISSQHAFGRRAVVRLLGVFSSEEEARDARQRIVDREVRLGAKPCEAPAFGYVGDDSIHIAVHPGIDQRRVLSFTVAETKLCGSEGQEPEPGAFVFDVETSCRE